MRQHGKTGVEQQAGDICIGFLQQPATGPMRVAAADQCTLPQQEINSRHLLAVHHQ